MKTETLKLDETIKQEWPMFIFLLYNQRVLEFHNLPSLASE